MIVENSRLNGIVLQIEFCNFFLGGIGYFDNVFLFGTINAEDNGIATVIIAFIGNVFPLFFYVSNIAEINAGSIPITANRDAQKLIGKISLAPGTN